MSEYPARWAVVSLMLLAAGLRLAAFAALAPPDGPADPDDYGKYAAALLAGNATADLPVAFRPPLYWLLLAPFMAVDAPMYRGVALLHAMLGAAAVWLTVRFGVKLGLSPRAASLAGLLTATSPSLVHLSSQLMTETLFAVLLLMTLIVWHDANSWSRAAWTGVLVGLAHLTRPTATAVWLALGVTSLLTVQTRIRYWLIASVVAFVVVFPWAERNRQLLGEFVFTSTHGGYTLWLGQNQSFYKTEVLGGRNWSHSPNFENWTLENEKLVESEKLDELGRDRRFGGLAKDWMRAHPIAALHSIVYHVRTFGSPWPRSGPERLRPFVAVYYAAFLIAVLGGFLVLPSWRGVWLPLLATILATTLVHAVYWSNMRMRAPIEPLLALLLGMLVDRMGLRRNPP